MKLVVVHRCPGSVILFPLFVFIVTMTLLVNKLWRWVYIWRLFRRLISFLLGFGGCPINWLAPKIK